MVYRIYVEKKEGLANEAVGIFHECVELLGIKNLQKVRLLNRYDAENITEELFNYAVGTVFSEPQQDETYTEIPEGADTVFAVEFLPGQFDMRADSASQCISLISQGDRPVVKSARVYLLYGKLTQAEIEQIKKYVVNPVEARLADLEMPKTLKTEFEVPSQVKTLDGFIDMSKEVLEVFLRDNGLAMDIDDLLFCQQYFKSENRNPTYTEIKMIDTYWSDHCRHTTFLTNIDKVSFEDALLEETYNDYIATRAQLGRTKPVCLMDIATLAVRYLKKEGKLEKLDESEEINACTVKIKVEIDGKEEDWLLLFKNETHNHPTEIEPFGGAATCIGGAIRDPLSGRSYVYAAMRVTGAANPLRPISETLEGKLPQRKIVTTAAAGYSSYGNQIGLATGLVDEIYHEGYAAKRMEIGAVIAGAPAENVRRERPNPGDIVILLGGRTGRDGCGGATGSSKSHSLSSLESCGAEVQKGNAPEERKLQRLFRNPEASKLIKRCNDFGAGGVSVAIGELADGLLINLDKVPKKYEGLDGTELAISESQERMAVVVERKDADRFCDLAYSENLEATIVAEVTESPRLVLLNKGEKIVNLSREFLNSNGAEKHIDIVLSKPESYDKELPKCFTCGIKALADDLNVCSKRGLSERFDSTIGRGTVLMPFGGKNQLTPIQAMVNKVSAEKKDSSTCSVMSYGYNPYISEKSPYHGAYLAVVESIAKLITTGADFTDTYLTFQEYFEKPLRDGRRWGKPMAALLGAFKAQKDFGIGSIGGKDSMSGSFEKIDVPPTLVSFAVTTTHIDNVISPEFKKAGHRVVLLSPEYDKNGLPVASSLIKNFNTVSSLIKGGKVRAAYTPTYGGVAEAVMKMCFGNGFGFEFSDKLSLSDIFGYSYGSFVLELCDCYKDELGTLIGYVKEEATFTYASERVCGNELLDIYENKLESVFSCNIKTSEQKIEKFSFKASSYSSPAVKTAKPTFLIPVFPGTNCEYDSAKAVEYAGGKADIFVINNLTAKGISDSVEAFASKLRTSQAVFVPGGFSGGDEPDGSGKFITAFFRNAEIKEEIGNLLDSRDGLMCGICNGFQALIKLGLVPYGKIIDTDDTCPTLTFNTISRHQSRIVRTRICSNKSPWLKNTNVDDIYNVPISHGEGRFIASDALISELSRNGQIATQYVDAQGNPTYDIHYNPNGSVCAIEGITSPDGRVIGKMGHSERIGDGLYKNVYGDYDIKMFKSAVEYFTK